MSGWIFFLLFPVVLVLGTFVFLIGNDLQRWFAVAAVVVAFVVACLNGCGYNQALDNSAEWRTFTIQEKQRGGDDTPALVYTTDGNVFSVRDSIWYFTFDASDRYAKLKTGNTYTCKVIGWRIRFTSDWENIVDCKEW